MGFYCIFKSTDHFVTKQIALYRECALSGLCTSALANSSQTVWIDYLHDEIPIMDPFVFVKWQPSINHHATKTLNIYCKAASSSSIKCTFSTL